MRVKLTIVDGGLCERDADKGGDGEARESVAEGSPARARTSGVRVANLGDTLSCSAHMIQSESCECKCGV